MKLLGKAYALLGGNAITAAPVRGCRLTERFVGILVHAGLEVIAASPAAVLDSPSSATKSHGTNGALFNCVSLAPLEHGMGFRTSAALITGTEARREVRPRTRTLEYCILKKLVGLKDRSKGIVVWRFCCWIYECDGCESINNWRFSLPYISLEHRSLLYYLRLLDNILVHAPS